MVQKAGVHARTRETKQKYSNFIKQKPCFNSSGSPANRILSSTNAGNQAVQKLLSQIWLNRRMPTELPDIEPCRSGNLTFLSRAEGKKLALENNRNFS
jgi:hypothetical protein